MNNPIQKWAKDLNRHLTEEDNEITSKQMNRWSTSYMIREMQIKTMRYHYTPLRTSKILNTDSTKYWQGCGATRTLAHCWCEWHQMVRPLWKTAWQFLKNLSFNYHTTQQLYSWAIIPEKWKFMCTQITVNKWSKQFYL